MGNALTDYCLVQVVARRYRAGEIIDQDRLYEPHCTAPFGPFGFEDYLEDVTFEEIQLYDIKRGALHLAGPADDPANVAIVERHCRITRDLIGLYFQGVGTFPAVHAASHLDDEAGQIGWVDILSEEEIGKVVEDILLMFEANPEATGVHLLTVWCFEVDTFPVYESSYPDVESWAEYLGPFDDSKLKTMVVQTEESE